MKRISSIILILFFSISVIQPVSGQKLLKNIAKKVKDKTEKKIEDKVVDKSMEKVDEVLESDETEEKSDKKKNNSQIDMSGMLEKMGISSEPVPYNDNYNFDFLIQMHIESFDKKGELKDQGEFITHLDPESQSMAYEVISGNMAKSGQGMFILDMENEAMIILNNEKDEKTGIVYGIGSFFQNLGQTYEDEDFDPSQTPEMYLANPHVSKTGKTKKIAGYKCEEYKYSDEYNEGSYWITKDLKLKSKDFFSTLFKTSLISHGMPWGYVMEATSLDKKNGEKSSMQVTNVDTNSNKNFSLGDYNIQNIGSFNIPTE